MRGMYSQCPQKHLILYIFNSFMVFYYPTPFPHHLHFCDYVNDDDAIPSQDIPHQWQRHACEKARERLPPWGYTFDRAGLMSAAKATLSR